MHPGDDMLSYGSLPDTDKIDGSSENNRNRINALSEGRGRGGGRGTGRGRGAKDFWLKLLLSDFEDDRDYFSKRENALFHELYVWAPRFIDGVEVVFPGSGNNSTDYFMCCVLHNPLL